MQLVDFLISKGLDINRPETDYSGSNPIIGLISNEKWDAVRFLIRKGYDVSIVQKKHPSPLAEAARILNDSNTLIEINRAAKHVDENFNFARVFRYKILFLNHKIQRVRVFTDIRPAQNPGCEYLL